MHTNVFKFKIHYRHGHNKKAIDSKKTPTISPVTAPVEVANFGISRA